MEFYLKIKTEFNCFVNINNHLNHELNTNKFINLLCNINKDEQMKINIEPSNNEANLLPYKIIIFNLNNKIKINSNQVDILNYENKFILKLKKLNIDNSFNIIYTNNNVNIFNTNVTNFTTNNKTLTLKEKFTKVEFKSLNGNSIYILKNDYKNYVIILKNNKIIFSDYFNEINLNKEINILSNIKDITKHSVLTTISNNNISQKVVYFNNNPKLITNEKILPLAFIQALKLNNINLCKFYLDENLKNIATLENLKNYFGSFSKVETDFSNNENKLILFNENNYKIFKFNISNLKINKITLL